MPSGRERDYRRRVAEIGPTRFLPGTTVEIVRDVRLPEPPRFSVFDFDGTLSLIRAGWPDVMVPMMVEILREETSTRETDEELSALVTDFVMQLNGKQTIYQMIRVAEEVRARGGSPADPLTYKRLYHDRLMEKIRGRREGLADGSISPEELLVPGSHDLLGALRELGVQLSLASGTDVNYVREEAELLRIAGYFDGRIYGALDAHESFSKQMVIEQILRENNVEGSRLIGFGDGYVEIDNVKEAGGTAVAVASDETHRSGRPDPWKRDRLIGVGADLVIPDYRDWRPLVNYLWGI